MKIDEAVAKVRQFASKPTEISDLLEEIFFRAVEANPKLIVELGVGDTSVGFNGGSSNYVLHLASQVTGANFMSVDIGDCSKANSDPSWLFVQGRAEDVGKQFPKIAKKFSLPQSVDVIFLDTSHTYEDTVAEMNVWIPLLSKKGIIMFHDTNLRPEDEGTRRRSGALINRIDLKRNCIRPIEEMLGIKIDETKEQMFYKDNWKVIHYPYCCGLTILMKQ